MDDQEAKIELDAVLSTMVDGVIIINERGVMRLFNTACETIFGYDPEEVLGQNVKMLMPSPYREEHDDYLSNYKQTHDKKIIGIGREVSGRRKDGSVFPMDLAVGETRLDGKPLFVGVIRDLTQRYAEKQKFDQLQEEHFHLSRVSAMNEMGSAIAHEITQPMAASINYLEAAKLLLGRASDLDSKRVSNILGQAIEQTQRASDIISRMRGFIERGDVEKHPTPVRDIIEKASRLAMFSFSADHIILVKNISEDLPDVLVNSVQIQQVLVNLIKNACEAMFDSETKTLTISAHIYSDNDFVEITVTDTGHGLTASGLERLFVPFSSEKAEGLGVGLSISQSIVNHHGGQIWARQNQSSGTVFHFTLPIANRG